MEAIMSYAALICAAILGLSWGILDIPQKVNKNKHFTSYNRLETQLMSLPKPPIKIFISLLIVIITILCGAIVYLAKNDLLLSIFNFIAYLWVYYSIGLLFYCCIHPYLLKQDTIIPFIRKYKFAFNLMAIIIFVILTIIGIIKNEGISLMIILCSTLFCAIVLPILSRLLYWGLIGYILKYIFKGIISSGKYILKKREQWIEWILSKD